MRQESNDDKLFLQIIEFAPLVSIDLIVKDRQGQVLLGRRANRPARGYWFVPGGRIKKNEKITDAIRRISRTELGIEILLPDAQLLGVFEHMYDDNYLGEEGINTHYVVLAFSSELESEVEILPDDQHAAMKWWPIDKLLGDPNVHQYVKNYFT